jgi:hypothetical protein
MHASPDVSAGRDAAFLSGRRAANNQIASKQPPHFINDRQSRAQASSPATPLFKPLFLRFRLCFMAPASSRTSNRMKSSFNEWRSRRRSRFLLPIAAVALGVTALGIVLDLVRTGVM